ncbi:unnamed protein product [Closterium sp. Yama58-4]|nr:unnamed protein product [Closterium sp. Yama58-4]
MAVETASAGEATPPFPSSYSAQPTPPHAPAYPPDPRFAAHPGYQPPPPPYESAAAAYPPPVPPYGAAGGASASPRAAERSPSPPKSEGFAMPKNSGDGLTAAERMMMKMGWKAGQGLGKQEQGITTPLMAKKTDKHGGVIVAAKPLKKGSGGEGGENNAAGAGGKRTKLGGVALNGPPSKVVLLRNMVGPGEVDEELEEEVAGECLKYGTSVENKEPRKSTVKDLAKKFDIKPNLLVQGPKVVSRHYDSELEELKTRLEKLHLLLDPSQRDEVGSILEIVGKALRRRSSDRSENKWTEISLKSTDLQTQASAILQGDDDALLSLLASKGEEVSRLKAEVMELKSRMVGERGIMRYEIQGSEELGSLLFVVALSDDVAHPSQCNIRWYRSSKDGRHTQLIIGTPDLSQQVAFLMGIEVAFLMGIEVWHWQFYGLRWSTNSSSLGACWVPRKGVMFNIMFQSITERNIAIQVARSYASKLKVDVSGPEGHFHGHDE